MRPLTAVLAFAGLLAADDCAPSQLGGKETQAKFLELDRAAQAAFDQGQFAVAAGHYREAACLVPQSARAFYGLGVAEAAAGRFPAARKALETAYALAPSNAMPLAMLVRVGVAMEDLEKVKETLRTAAQRFPGDVELHSSLGRFLAEKQLLDLALAESLRSQQAGAADPSATVALAVLENTVGAFAEAIRNAETVAQHASAPDAVKAAAAGIVGLSYESTGRREDAILHLQRAIEFAPAQENSYVALAFLYEKARRFREAVEVLQKGRKQIPGSAAFLLPLGSNLVWAEQYEAGVAVLNELIRQSPKIAEAYLRLAEAYRNTGRPELETQTLEELSRVVPGYPMVSVLIARALLTANPVDYAKVLQTLAQAEKTAPNDSEVFFLKGKALAATGRRQEAIADFQRASELRPMDPAPYYQLGLLYTQLGQADLAAQAFRRMQHIKPGP